jgi:hypothetical protein
VWGRRLWAPRARDPDNRDSAQTWLGKNLGRLHEEIRKLIVGVGDDVIVKRGGSLRLNEVVIVSDVAAFMMAVERARGARGADQVASAEDEFGTRVPGLLTRVVRNPRTSGPNRLDDAWQQVCACLGGEGDLELCALYDRLRRGLIGAAAPSRSEATPARR